MVAVVEDGALAPEMAVEPARHADRPALDAARELRRVARLADQVEMGALDRELADAEPVLAAAVDEGCAEHLAQLEAAEPRDIAADALGDVDGKARLERGACCMAKPRVPGAVRLAPRPGARTSVGAEAELLLPRARHLNGHM